MTVSFPVITQISPDSLGDVNLAPQAVLSRPIGYFIGLGYQFEDGTDDLDDYEGAFFELDDGARFALIRYRGNPRDRITLYFDENMASEELIARILPAFGLPSGASERIEVRALGETDAAK